MPNVHPVLNTCGQIQAFHSLHIFKVLASAIIVALGSASWLPKPCVLKGHLLAGSTCILHFASLCRCMAGWVAMHILRETSIYHLL